MASSRTSASPFEPWGKTPGFTLIAALSIALGIGANTAIFSLIDTVMWRMLPVKDPAALWAVGDGLTFKQYRMVRDEQSAADVAAYSAVPAQRKHRRQC